VLLNILINIISAKNEVVNPEKFNILNLRKILKKISIQKVTYAEDYLELVSACSARDPLAELSEEEYEYLW
jgi:hypothetical protein